jgi:pimeloyl-ACP methyl ester carboxylesterase
VALTETRFAKAGDLSIAYQTVGNGHVGLILVPQWLSNIEQYWEHPAAAYFLRRLASFSRLIMFDKRGTGLSDSVPTTETLEERMDDVIAVMDAVDCERAVLFGPSEGGPMAALFAATYPDRCVSLILYGTLARWLRSPDYPQGRPAELVTAYGKVWIDGWGTGASLNVLAPTLAGDERFRRWWGRFERHSVRPAMMAPIFDDLAELDIRAVLPAIRVPTLILHRRGDRLVDVANGRYLAAQIAHARYVELPGDDHIYFAGDSDALLDEIEEFVTGSRGVHDRDRVLATVMFTDIVRGSHRRPRRAGPGAGLGNRPRSGGRLQHRVSVSRGSGARRGPGRVAAVQRRSPGSPVRHLIRQSIAVGYPAAAGAAASARSSTISPSAASTRTVSPGPNRPSRIASASGSTSRFWITRLSGRAP